MGLDNLEQTYSSDTQFSVAEPINAQMRDYIAQYTERFGVEPSWVGAFVHDTYSVLASVLDRCDYTSEAIRECLKEVTDTEGILGTLDFSTQNLRVPFMVRNFDNGEITVEKIIN